MHHDFIGLHVGRRPGECLRQKCVFGGGCGDDEVAKEWKAVTDDLLYQDDNRNPNAGYGAIGEAVKKRAEWPTPAQTPKRREVDGKRSCRRGCQAMVWRT